MFFGRKKSASRYEAGPAGGATAPRVRPGLFQTGPSISQSGGFGTPGSVIRLPVGVMAVAILIFVALLILAYEVGFSRGQAKATDHALNSPEQPRRITSTPNTPGGEPIPIEPDSPLASNAQKPAPDRPNPTGTIRPSPIKPSDSATTSRTDPDTSGRVTGLNYCIIATYGKDEAERLSTFIKSKGVDTVVVLTHNKKLFQVVDLRGFTAEEYHSPLFEEHRKRLRQFGREWKDKQHGPDDLKDIWVEKFTGG